VTALSALPAEARHVVIGEDCLPKVTKEDLSALVKFAQGGGTVVVLAQNNAKEAFQAAWGNWAELEGRVPPCAYELKPGPIPTTVAHLPEQKDALTADLTSDDVRFWANDGAVAVYGSLPTTTPGVKSLVYCNRTEIDTKCDLLLRVSLAKGQFYLCQLLLADNVAPEPIAKLLLARMINPAAMPATAPAETTKQAK
jgi:hypothetical protein